MTEIEKLFEAATEGPWQAVIADPHEAPGPIYAGIVCLIEAGENGISVLAESGFVPKEDWAANAAFIAAARTAVPELLAALKGAEGEAKRYEAECRGLDEECDKIHRRAEKAEAERDAAVAALRLAIDNIQGIADGDDIPSTHVRAVARAALASNSGGGADINVAASRRAAEIVRDYKP